MAMNDKDFNYIIRISSLILRQGGLSTKKDDRILNVYSHPTVVLPEAILDANTKDVGQYLIWKYISTQGLFNLSKDDCPDVEKIDGPKEIIRKLKTSKGTTIQRVGKKLKDVTKKERDTKEIQRKKLVAKQTKLADQKSSEMNACQAILKPDCSKPKVQKSTGIQKALLHLLKEAIEKLDEVDGNEDMNMDKYFLFGQKTLPAYIVTLISHVTVEFATVKFKTRAHDGKHYLKFVEDSIINKTISLMPKVKQMVICEEKYSFTPDHFKAATRTQRQVNKPLFPITHLKTNEEILSSTTFDKTSLVTTMEGKSLISTFIARNIEQLKFKRDIIIDIDSEYIMEHETDCPLGYNAFAKNTQPQLDTNSITHHYPGTKLRHSHA
ncbi:unnamed protein product [Mytilus edulis]|uniref:Uncharacterized protein n=1 Tax=Mytilus edulis TaxID=6550 RepID=A0A8S3V0P8_MYTED|nr:unnamed protein product [Mytilus edulis]